MFATRAALLFTATRRLFKKDIPLKIREADPWPEGAPFVSVIVPCYNHGQYVGEAVQSILDQTWQNLEIIVVNDGSTEQETIDILNNFRQPKTRLIHLAQNMGLPAARNAGIKEAQGKYICCLDADDKLHPTYIEKAIAAMEANAGISFVWSWTRVFGIEDRVWYTPQFDPYSIMYYNQSNAPAVFKKSAWERAGGYQEDMQEGAEDWEFWIRLTRYGYRGYRISEKMILVRRMGYSFVHRAAEKMDVLVEKIRAHNLDLYENSREKVDKIVNGYCDVYSMAPFSNMKSDRHYLNRGTLPKMVISNAVSERVMELARSMAGTDSPNFIWVSKSALDEKATDLLYELTPYVYVLPNFLPRYVWDEFVQNLRVVRNVSSVEYLH